jgi:Fe-Mn family superoxide dismutase
MDARIQPCPSTPPHSCRKLLTSHHQNNYGGAVKRLNAIRAQLATLPFSTVPDSSSMG